MMKRKSLWVVAIFWVLGLSVFAFNLHFKPPYVADAEDKLESNLTYTFGPGNCDSRQEPDGEWDIICDVGYDKHSFQYQVYPASDDGDNAEGFYLVALNTDARENINTDLLSYLDIRKLKG